MVSWKEDNTNYNENWINMFDARWTHHMSALYAWVSLVWLVEMWRHPTSLLFTCLLPLIPLKFLYNAAYLFLLCSGITVLTLHLPFPSPSIISISAFASLFPPLSLCYPCLPSLPALCNSHKLPTIPLLPAFGFTKLASICEPHHKLWHVFCTKIRGRQLRVGKTLILCCFQFRKICL